MLSVVSKPTGEKTCKPSKARNDPSPIGLKSHACRMGDDSRSGDNGALAPCTRRRYACAKAVSATCPCAYETDQYILADVAEAAPAFASPV